MATNFEGREILDEDEIHAMFAALFPNGWRGADVLAELAPNGWENSPLFPLFHPSAERLHEERLAFHRNLASLPFRKPDAPPPPPEPTLEETLADYEPSPAEPERECQELVGLCLWDIFSDNHEVTDDDGRLVDLGSMRGSAGALADVVNKQSGPKPPPKPGADEMFQRMFTPDVLENPKYAEMVEAMRKEMIGDGGYTYMDFYMGTAMLAGRADLSPVYRMIFRRLFARGMDWKYTFPRFYAVDMRPLGKALEEQKKRERGEEEWEEYDPSAEFEKEQEEAERDHKLAEMNERLDDAHREAVEAAQDREPPKTVLVYQEIYGDFPTGWPPSTE